MQYYLLQLGPGKRTPWWLRQCFPPTPKCDTSIVGRLLSPNRGVCHCLSALDLPETRRVPLHRTSKVFLERRDRERERIPSHGIKNGRRYVPCRLSRKLPIALKKRSYPPPVRAKLTLYFFSVCGRHSCRCCLRLRRYGTRTPSPPPHAYPPPPPLE